MSALNELSDHLQRFWALPHHKRPKLAKKFAEVQAWQRNRMRQTHRELFAEPDNRAMADYFLHKLYAGDEFPPLARQLERIVPKAQKLEKLAPAKALETGTLGIESAVLATELDLKLAKWLLKQDLPVTEDNMLKAYRAVNDADARLHQLEQLQRVCERIDKYVNSFMLQNAFKLAKGQAYKYNYHALYDFIADGFSAMKPLKNVQDFIDPFVTKERQIIANVHEPNFANSLNTDNIDSPFAV